MKNKYIVPEMEVIELEDADIITTSGESETTIPGTDEGDIEIDS